MYSKFNFDKYLSFAQPIMSLEAKKGVKAEPPPPEVREMPALDGGYGWIILFVAFMISFIMDGCMYSFGIILNDIKRHFGVTQDVANVVQSLNVGFLFSSGPISAGLAKQFGCRAVIMVSSVIVAFVNVLAAYLPSIFLLQIIFGVIGGIGFGCTYLTCFIILVAYFDKKLGIANGLTMAGSGMGAFAFAPATKMLVSMYDWRITMVILGCIMIQCCVLGSLLRPLSFHHKAKLIPKEIELLELTGSFSLAHKGEKHGDNEPFHERIAFFRITKGILKETFNFKLFIQNVPFAFLVLSNFFIFIGYFVPFIYIPIRAEELGIEHYAWIISIIGIVNIPSRIIFGIVVDRKWISSVNMNTACCAVATGSLFLFYPLTEFWMQSIFAVIYAIAIAGTNCLTTTYLRDAIGSEKFANGNGILNIARGIGCLIGPVIAGRISESTKSSLHSFNFAAGCFFVATFFSLFVSCYNVIQRCMESRRSKKDEEIESAAH